jgi:hypothetical protein
VPQKPVKGRVLTQHTGLPPRSGAATKPARSQKPNGAKQASFGQKNKPSFKK